MGILEPYYPLQQQIGISDKKQPYVALINHDYRPAFIDKYLLNIKPMIKNFLGFFGNERRNLLKYCKIMINIPNNCQMSIFSATLTNEVMNISKHIMNDPYHILLKTSELTLEGIKQYYVDATQENYKFDVLLDLYEHLNITCAIIYINSQKKCDFIYDKLLQNNF